jgi:hypothetical protein
MIESISAIILATHMQRAVRFYSSLGFQMLYGGKTASFTGFRAGPGYLNLIAQGDDKQWSWWGRVIFYVDDVDALCESARQADHQPSTTPRTLLSFDRSRRPRGLCTALTAGGLTRHEASI